MSRGVLSFQPSTSVWSVDTTLVLPSESDSMKEVTESAMKPTKIPKMTSPENICPMYTSRWPVSCTALLYPPETMTSNDVYTASRNSVVYTKSLASQQGRPPWSSRSCSSVQPCLHGTMSAHKNPKRPSG